MPPSPTPDPMPLATGPESATHLVGPDRAHPDGADGLRGDLGRSTARCSPGPPSSARRKRSDPGRANCPRWPRRASRCPSSWSKRRPRAGCAGRSSTSSARKPKGRRLRYAVGELLHVHALHGRVERARAGRPAPALAGRRADGLHACSPRAPETTCCRRSSRTCARTPRPSRRSAEAPASRPRHPQRRPEHDATCHASDRYIPGLRRLGCTPPGVPRRVTTNGQQRTDPTSLRSNDGAHDDHRRQTHAPGASGERVGDPSCPRRVRRSVATAR